MASNSRRRSSSSGRSNPRKRVVIGAEETVRVRYNKNQPQVEAERTKPGRASSRTAGSGRTSGASKQGKRLSAAKRDERARRQQQQSLKRVATLVAAAAALVAVIWGGVALTRAPFLRVTEVQVEGANRLTADQVIDVAAVPPDTTILRLPKARIIESLEGNPWVAQAEVSRVFPTGVLIRIEERVPVATVDAGGAELWLVDRSGVWLGERTAEDESLVTIRAIEGLTPVGGRRASSPELANAIAVARGLSDELKSLTRAISAPSIDRTAVITNDDVEVFIGEADGIADKDRVAREILEREKGKVVYINVRVVERPTWRGLE